MKRFVRPPVKNFYDVPRNFSVLYVFALIALAYFVNRFIQRPYTEWQNSRAEKGIKGMDDRIIDAIDSCFDRMWQTVQPTPQTTTDRADAGMELINQSCDKALEAGAADQERKE